MLTCGFVMLDMVDPARQTDVVRGYSYRQIITRPILGGGFMTALAVPLIARIGLPAFAIGGCGDYRCADHLVNKAGGQAGGSRPPGVSWIKPHERKINVSLYTKNGRPLQVSGSYVYGKSDKAVGRISGDKVFGTDGRYVGMIAGNRLVYRSTDSAVIGSSFSIGNLVGSAMANSAGSAIWGDEA
jgi:hypothetical protein